MTDVFWKMYHAVEKTHKGLGKYYMLTLTSILGGKGVWLIGEQGSGKSAIGLSILNLLKPYYYLYVKNQITLYGLVADNDIRRHSNVLVFVDDYSASGTYYAKLNLLTALCELNYSRYFSVQKKDAQATLNFNRFDYIVCLQPTWLESIINTTEYNGLLKDKVIRVYVLNRATKPHLDIPLRNFELNLNLDIKKVSSSSLKKLRNWSHIYDKLQLIYSKSRALETALALYKGLQILETSDISFIMSKFANIIASESYFLLGEDIKTLNKSLIKLCSIYSIKKTFTSYEFAKEFKLNPKYVSYLLNTEAYKQYCYSNHGHYKPFPIIKQILKQHEF